MWRWKQSHNIPLSILLVGYKNRYYRHLQIFWRLLSLKKICNLEMPVYKVSVKSPMAFLNHLKFLLQWQLDYTKLSVFHIYFVLKAYDPNLITFGFIHRNGVLGIRWKPLFFSLTCKILRPTDVDFKTQIYHV